MTLALTILSVTAAAVLHRVSGMGFALIAMPLLILLHGPVTGLQLGLALGLCVSVIALATCWRDLNWRKARALAGAGLVIVPVGGWALTLISPPVTLVVLGTVLAALLLVTLMVGVPDPDGPAVAPPVARQVSGSPEAMDITTLSAGSLAGLVHVMGGLSALVLTTYAVRIRWPQREFVATAQAVFIVLNIASLVSHRTPRSELVAGMLLTPALLVGVSLGTLIARRMSAERARRLTLAVAMAAAAATTAKGLVSL